MSRMGSSTLMMLGATKKSRCKVFGKVFYHTAYHAYHGCCSYTCMREDEKAQTSKSNRVFTPAKLNARIEKCKARIEHYTALADDSNITQKRRIPRSLTIRTSHRSGGMCACAAFVTGSRSWKRRRRR